MNWLVGEQHIVGHDSGNGPTVLLLHGWGTDHSTFRLMIPELENSHRVIAPDLPGFGGSEEPKTAWDINSYSECVLQLLKKIGLPKVDIIIGHSFGGRIALELAAKHNLPTKYLVLLASHGLKDWVPLTRRTLQVMAPLATILPSSIRNVITRKLSSPDYARTSGVMRETFKKIINQDVSPYAKSISVPTLLIYGSEDTTTPPLFGENLHRLIPNSSLHLIPKSGHYVHLDNPEAVNQFILEFIL